MTATLRIRVAEQGSPVPGICFGTEGAVDAVHRAPAVPRLWCERTCAGADRPGGVRRLPSDTVRRWGSVHDAGDVDENTVLAVLTHDMKVGIPLLGLALRSPASFVGALGGRRTTVRRWEALSLRGTSHAELARLHAPMGLDIGASTPQEAAIAIMAEIVPNHRSPTFTSCGAQHSHPRGRRCLAREHDPPVRRTTASQIPFPPAPGDARSDSGLRVRPARSLRVMVRPAMREGGERTGPPRPLMRRGWPSEAGPTGEKWAAGRPRGQPMR